MNFIDPLAMLFGPWSYTVNVYSALLRIFLSVVFGSIIGCERSSKRHSAGLRTFLLVTLLGCLCMVLDLVLSSSLYLFSAAAILGTVVVSGNSILFSSKKQIKGLTTSVGLWMKDRMKLQDFIYTLRNLSLRVDDIELNSAYLGSGLSVYTISLTNYKEKKQSHRDLIQALSTLEYVSFVEEIR